MPELVGVGALFIDDIVLPTGATYMGQLGGGVAHALMGAALWDCTPGISAVYGNGLPTDALALLEGHLDTSGLVQLDLPQMRAWQIFEEDGTRRELYRIIEQEPFFKGTTVSQLPQAYTQSHSFYLLQGIDTIQHWVDSLPDALICWEPLQQVMIPENRTLFTQVMQATQVDIVSPNLEEAQAVYGKLSPESLLDAMLTDGAQAAVLRMGPAGSLIKQATDANATYIPAVSVEVIDQTGAGNTYCGAYLLGVLRGKPPAQAGCLASVAASFCLESQGVVNPTHVNPAERDRRLELLQEQIA